MEKQAVATGGTINHGLRMGTLQKLVYIFGHRDERVLSGPRRAEGLLRVAALFP